jgi:hypothetical protein
MKDDWADWSDYYGGTLEFDIKVTGEGEYKDNVPVFLELPGALGSVAYATNLIVNPDLGNWTHYEIELINSNFFVTEPAGGGDLKDRLADITGMLISADLLTGDDITCIDNVRVNANPVPEPSTVILISTGMLGLIAVKRKNRKRYCQKGES